MMVKKQNRIKQGKSVSDDEKQIKSLIIIFVVVVLICVGLYFFTDVAQQILLNILE